jgi:hypothetical protein
MKTRRAINKEELKNVLLELMSEDADFRREISVRLLREELVTRSYLDESLIKLSKQFDDKLLELRREIAEENKAMRAEFWEEMRKLREEMARENQAMRAEFWEEIRKLREELNAQVLALRKDGEAMRAEFWEEIRKLREELNAQVLALRKDGEAMRAEFWEEIRKLREEMARENQAMRAEFWREMNKFREEFTESLKQFERSFNIRLSIVGNRWGINAEMAFKEGMKTIVEKEFGWKVTKWRYEGILSDIHPKRDKYEIDVVISDSEVILVEIKGSASEADVIKFYDNVRAYERVNGVKAKRKVLIVALAYPDARLEAQKYGIELISPSTFPEIPIEFIL